MTDFHAFNWIEFHDLMWVAAGISLLTILAIRLVLRRR
jgi:hypothetical protein